MVRYGIPLVVAMVACGGTEQRLERLGKRCVVNETSVRCPHATRVIEVGAAGWSNREVHYQLPAGAPPARGWPVVIVFQGSLVSAGDTWSADAGDRFGAIYLARTYAQLLEAGFAVITPETSMDGRTFWDSNVIPYRWKWTMSNDHELIVQLLAQIRAGVFGPLDGDALFATGISSGGYMTSRMAVSYPGRFRALAIHSGSYATCAGPLCTIPALRSDHPPTLLLHGTGDRIVGVDTAQMYALRLQQAGIEHRLIERPGGHVWLPDSGAAIVRWFRRYVPRSR